MNRVPISDPTLSTPIPLTTAAEWSMIKVLSHTSNSPRRRTFHFPAHQTYFSVKKNLVDRWAGFCRSRRVGTQRSQNFFGHIRILFRLEIAVLIERSRKDSVKALTTVWIGSERIGGECDLEHLTILLRALVRSFRSSMDQAGTRIERGVDVHVDRRRKRFDPGRQVNGLGND